MPILRVLDGNGDRNIRWSREAVEGGDSEAQSAVREAERIFATERKRGAIAFRVAPGEPAERVTELDLQAEETIVIPPMVGA